MTPTSLAATYAFFAGLCAGSFLNVCIARWPRELSVVRPRSRCPHCGHQLAWFENIPLFSWLVLRGRCRCCDESISVAYPLGELAIGLLWMACVLRFGPSFTALRVAIVLTLLVGVVLTDLRHYLIPDGFTIAGLVWTLGTALAAPFIAESPLFAGPYDALVGACAGAGLIAVIGWLGEVALRREAMGMGDMTLMAFVGGALGPTRAIATVFLGATMGAVVFLAVVYPLAVMRRGRAAAQTELPLGAAPVEIPLVPFGVFLAPAAVVMLLWGERLVGRVIGY
ncbi:MAG: prepilin peptidase [Gemmatimonadaceae bacterium]|nr:prepilin peptidase [Gemmatimonadaceae bacterium]